MISHFWDTVHFETSALNDPKVTLNTTRSKVPYIYMYMCVTNVLESQISHFLLPLAVFKIQSCWYSEEHQLTSEWPWTLNSLGTLYTLNAYLRGPIFFFFCFTLRTTVSKIQGCWKLAKSEMHRMTSDWSWTLITLKNTLYILNTYPEAQILILFCSTTTFFQDTINWLLKMANFWYVPNDLRLTLKS